MPDKELAFNNRHTVKKSPCIWGHPVFPKSWASPWTT